MDNKEKYEIYKSKLKKQVRGLFIISIVVFLLTCPFAGKTLINIFDFDDFYQNVKSDVINFFGGKIAIIAYSFSVISVFLAMLLMLGLSFAMMVKVKKDDFENISRLLNIGLIAFIISYGIFAVEFIVVASIFIIFCLVTLFLAIPQMWAIFSPLLNLFLILIPGTVAGALWFIRIIDIKSTLKNLKFYRYLK